MSPVFRHGKLRLYLLKLLDEAPRHGYEVIRLLQDRFMGVYAPSPGTIYPRLARLEEEGLVTHEEVDGKKVYSITDKGREEIRSRLGDLADLEDELTESLRDVAREISVDVRDTVRTIREELASAAREFRMDGGRGDRASGKATAADETDAEPAADRNDEARRIREDAQRAREQMRAEFRARNRGQADWAGWTAWSEWTSAKDWAGKDWPRGKGGPAGWGFSGEQTTGGAEAGKAGPRSRKGRQNPFSDLEGLAIAFANELRAAAKDTGNLGERSLNDLRDILTDTLAKVRDEVFGGAGSGPAAAASGADRPSAGADEPGPHEANPESDAAAGAPGKPDETK